MLCFRACLCIVVIAFTGISNGVPTPACGQKEAVNTCLGHCCTDYCPKGEETRACPADPPPAPAPSSPTCRCIFDYRRAENGTCIPTTLCPPFDCPRPYEKYIACPPYCPSDDCSQATKDGQCPYLGLLLPVVECQPACRCVQGYWRKNGICIPYDQC